MKQLCLAVALLGLMVRGYFIYQQRQIQSARQTLQSSQTISQLRRDARSPDAEAEAAVRGNPPPAAKAPAAPAAKAPAPPAAPAAPAAATARTEIEAALRELHVTTIMPGQPGMFILGKQDYSEGEDLPLPKGRKARVAAVDNDGVRLTCEGMAFRLDPPAAPDLAAMHKKK